MKRLATWITSGVTIFGLVIFSASMTRSQELFPAGQSRDTLFLVCVQCHSLDRVTTAKLTSADWEFMLYDMISRGAPVRDDEIDALKKYLVDNFAIDAK